MLPNIKPYPNGQLPYYSGRTGLHLGWLRPVKFTPKTVLCEVTDSFWDEPGQQIRLDRRDGHPMARSRPSLNSYIRLDDLIALLEMESAL